MPVLLQLAVEVARLSHMLKLRNVCTKALFQLINEGALHSIQQLLD